MPFIPVTPTETNIVEKITETIEIELGDKYINFDFTTKLRFLRGNKHNIKDATADLIRFTHWRHEIDIDRIDDKVFEIIKLPTTNTDACRPGAYDMHDRPAVFISVQRHFKNNRVIEHFEVFLTFLLERMIKLSKQDEHRIIVVIDMENFSMANMDYEVIRPLLNILQKNYPEILEKIYVIDSPFIFRACWLIIKPWLDPVTASKIEFIKRKKLYEYFHKDSIPDFTKPLEDIEALVYGDAEAYRIKRDEEKKNKTEVKKNEDLSFNSDSTEEESDIEVMEGKGGED